MKRGILKKAACGALALALALAAIPAFTAAAEAEPELPEVFDLRDVDTDGDGIGDACWVTPIKCQNPFATCWGFAAISSAETSILSSGLAAQDGYAAYADPENGLEELNLSEKHLAYFAMKTIDDPADPQYGEGFCFSGDERSSGRFNTGGFSYYATALFASGIGPVHEKLDTQLEYHGANNLCLAFKLDDGGYEPVWYSDLDDWNINSDYRFTQSYVLKESILLDSPSGKSGEEWESAVNAIKEVLYSGHAVEMPFYADTSRPGQEVITEFLSENWADYTYEPRLSDHEVTLIGWDDHYPKENFAHLTQDGQEAPLPEGDGAWLARNSWGSGEREFPDRGIGWGLLQGQDKGVYNAETGKYEYNAIEGAVNTGYFWVSYYDKSIQTLEALEFDSVTAEEGYYIAEHDYMPVTDMKCLCYDSEFGEANVFCVGDEVDAVRLDMVSYQTRAPGVDLHVDVYLLDEDWTDPRDGVLISQADASFKYGGFHKIRLDTPAVILRDRYFSVVVTQRAADGWYYCNYQLAFGKDVAEAWGSTAYAVGVINPRESYLFGDGEWWDLSDPAVHDVLMGQLYGDDASHYEMDNYPIKAYLAVMSETEIPGAAADYADLKSGAYYYDAADWILKNGYAMGTTPDTFSPDDPCSRAQILTWLWRAAGMPQPETADSPFRDVHKGDYYYYAVLWAYENGIIKGVGGDLFAPERTVTKAQTAAILYRYEKLGGGGFSGTWEFRLDYEDAEEIPEYAAEPFCWLTMKGVFEGDGNKLSPNATLTRAYAACGLKRVFADAPAE